MREAHNYKSLIFTILGLSVCDNSDIIDISSKVHSFKLSGTYLGYIGVSLKVWKFYNTKLIQYTFAFMLIEYRFN